MKGTKSSPVDSENQMFCGIVFTELNYLTWKKKSWIQKVQPIIMGLA